MAKIKNILDAPEGYFEKLPQQIQKRVQEKKQSRSIWQTTFNAKYALALASVALLLVFGSKYLINPKQDTIQSSLNEISSMQIGQYLLQNDIHEAELVEYLQDNDNSRPAELTEIEEILEDEIDFEEIEELL